MKICTKCKKVKEESLFYKTKGKLFSWCKVCSKLHQKQYNASKREYMRDYRKKKPNIIREWRLNNVEKIREYDRQRYLKDRHKTLLRIQKRRARLKGAEGSHTLEEWQDILYIYEYRCWVCRKPDSEVELTKDHVTPLSKGGSDFIENIMPLCRSCNSSKGTKGWEWYKGKI